MSMRFVSFADKVNHNESAWRQSKSMEERKALSKHWSQELLAAVETWSQNLEEGAFKTHGQCMADKQPDRSVSHKTRPILFK